MAHSFKVKALKYFKTNLFFLIESDDKSLLGNCYILALRFLF